MLDMVTYLNQHVKNSQDDMATFAAVSAKHFGTVKGTR